MIGSFLIVLFKLIMSDLEDAGKETFLQDSEPIVIKS